MILQLGFFAVGLLGLYAGAEWLVRGAARIARTAGISPLVVGLTVVAFGTSTPELMVSGLASFRDQADVAVGNVVGSNILNIALILGIAAVINPIRVDARVVGREVPIMIGVSAVLVILAFNGSLGRAEGFAMIAGLVAYLWYVLTAARRESRATDEQFREFETAMALEPHGERRIWDGVLVVVGLGVLALGAHLLVGSAVFFARAFGVSELTIGLTVVAIGTSLPELATAVVSAVRKEADIALGNVVGSNVFNILGILGVAAVIRPISIGPAVLWIDLPIMLAISIMVLPLAWTRFRLERWEGGVLVGSYLAFTWLLFARFA